MDLKATLGGYFEETPIPAELAPDKIAGFVKPRAVPKKTVVTQDEPAQEKKPRSVPKEEPQPQPETETEPEPKPELNASAFIKIVRYHHLTGSEFLSLLGNSKISNKAYQEIEQNPGLTVKRLIELLEESSLTAEDYEKLIIAVHRTAQLKQEAKSKLEAAKPEPAPKPAPVPVPEPKPVPDPASPAPEEKPEAKPTAHAPRPVPIWEKKQEEMEAKASEAEEKPAPEPSEEGSEAKPDLKDYMLEYDIDGDEDEKEKTGSNKPKFIIAAVAAVVLIAISFGLRYYFTGSLLPLADSGSIEQDLDENGIFRALGELAPQSAPAFAENRSYTAGGNLESSALLRSVTLNNRFIYYSENTLYIFEKLGGQLEQLDARQYGEDARILGLLQLDSGVAVVTAFEGRAYGFSYSLPDESGADVTYSSTVQRPETVIELLDAEKPENRSTIRLFGFSGNLAELRTEGDRIIAVTWESIAEGAAAQDASSFMPYVYTPYTGENDSRMLCSAENVLVPENPQYGSFAAVFSLDVSEGTWAGCAVAGGSGQLVSRHGSDLFICQGSLLARYDLSEGVKSSGICTLSGVIGEFSAVGVTDEEIRVTVLDQGSAALTVLDSELNILSEVRNLGNGESPLATCYNENETYLITQSGTLYGIDGSNQTMTASSASVTNAEIYKWNDNIGIMVSPMGDENSRTGISVSSVSLGGSLNTLSTLEISSKTVAENALDEYLYSPAEADASVMGASPEDNVLVVPVVYFDGISEVERFALLYVTEEGTLSFGSSICEYDRQSALIFAAVKDGIVTAVADSRLITAKTADGTIIGYFSSKPPTETYSYYGG